MSSTTFEDFVSQYDVLITKLSYKYYLENHTPDDMRQLILQVAYRVWQTYEYDKNSSLTNYLYKSIKYMIKDKLTKKSVETHSVEVDAEFEIDRRYIMQSNDNVETDIYIKDFEHKLWAYIDTLKHAKTMRYYYKGKMTLARISEIEGVSPEAVRLRLNTMYKKIKEHFGNEVYKYLQKLDKT